MPAASTMVLRPRWAVLCFFGFAAFAIAAIVTAPASLLAPALTRASPAIQYQELSGGLWLGRLRGLAVQGRYIGDIDFRLRPQMLLLGRVDADLDISGGPALGRARLALQLFSHEADLRDARIAFDLAALQEASLFGPVFEGQVTAEIDQVVWSRSGCARAAGHFRTNALDALAQRYVGDGLILEGPASCVADRLRIDLAGVNSEGETQIAIILAPDLSYQLSFSVAPRGGRFAEELKLLGFEDRNGAFVYDAAGALKGAGA